MYVAAMRSTVSVCESYMTFIQISCYSEILVPHPELA